MIKINFPWKNIPFIGLPCKPSMQYTVGDCNVSTKLIINISIVLCIVYPLLNEGLMLLMYTYSPTGNVEINSLYDSRAEMR